MTLAEIVPTRHIGNPPERAWSAQRRWRPLVAYGATREAAIDNLEHIEVEEQDRRHAASMAGS